VPYPRSQKTTNRPRADQRLVRRNSTHPWQFAMRGRLALMTRADAIAGLDLLLNSEDAFLYEKIIGKLRGYLSVM